MAHPGLPVSLDATTLQTGRDLYVRRCTSCHRLYPIMKFDDPTWYEILVNMQEQAELSPEELETVQSYLRTAREMVSRDLAAQ